MPSDLRDRPANCRNRLRDEGKPYPRSGCLSCKEGGLRGCPYERSDAMTHTKPAGHEDVPEDVRQLAASYAGRMADVLLGEGDDPDFIAILADCILADRSRRANVPAQATELAPDVKGLVEQIEALLDLDDRGMLVPHGVGRLARDLLSRAITALSSLSAPPAEAKPVAWTTSSRLATLRDNPNEAVTLWGSPAAWRDAPLYTHPDHSGAAADTALRAKAAEAVPEGMVLAEIAAERRRQMLDEGWSAEHDDHHVRGEMAMAAACYAVADFPSETAEQAAHNLWPWSVEWKPKDFRRNLIRAAALLVAEIERHDRATARRAPAAPQPRSTGEVHTPHAALLDEAGLKE